MTKQNISVTEAIYKRHAIRSYKNLSISQDIIDILLDAAVHAPTAMHQEAWAFAIIQDKKLLKEISDDAKKLLNEQRKNPEHPFHHESLDYFLKPEFNIFYNADALIVIYGKSDKAFIEADCWLAAQNLMLAAYAYGLGSCVIGLAVEILNDKIWKKNFDIPEEYKAIAPIVLGHPSGEVLSTSRKKPKIFFKK